MTVEEIISIVSESLNKVRQEYFKLKTTYQQEGVVRERVFCYELYHQMRNALGDNCLLTVSAEIDKSGHRDFDEEEQKNPDFVFHIPGHHYGNTIVCEVKGVINAKIIKDFETILIFLKHSYQAAIFVLYNYSRKELLEKLPQLKRDFQQIDVANRIYILTIPAENSLEKVVLLSEI